MGNLKALVFDLDDTLYPEESYVRSGFQAVADWLDRAGALKAETAFGSMWSAHAQGERGRIFDSLLASCPDVPEQVTVAILLKVYRSHAPSIALYPGMADFLDQAKAQFPHLGVISDGYLEAQEQKSAAIGLSRWANPILFTDRFGRRFWKPDPMAFQRIQAIFAVDPDEIVYIGNDPTKDFHAPKALGWHTVHLVMPHQGATGQPLSPAAIQLNGIQELKAHLGA